MKRNVLTLVIKCDHELGWYTPSDGASDRSMEMEMDM